MPDYVTINCQQKSRIRHNRFKSTIQMKVGASVSNLKLVPYQGEMLGHVACGARAGTPAAVRVRILTAIGE